MSTGIQECQEVSKCLRRYQEMSWQLSWCVSRNLKASKNAKRCQRVSKGVRRYLKERPLQLIVLRCQEVSIDIQEVPRHVKVCQKVSRAIKRCLDNCFEVSGSVYRHQRVARCVKVCQNMPVVMKRHLDKCLEVSRGVYRHPKVPRGAKRC